MAIQSRRKLTYEDFVRFPEDGQRHEILDGVHVVSPGANRRHQRVSCRLSAALEVFVRKNALGEVYPAPFDVLLSEHDIVEPDLLFVSASRMKVLTDDNVQGTPDLVIEILSPSSRRRDLGKKLARYEKLGVLEYWVLDAVEDAVQAYCRQGDRFLPPSLLSAANDDRLTTPLLPGLEVSLRELFER